MVVAVIIIFFHPGTLFSLPPAARTCSFDISILNDVCLLVEMLFERTAYLTITFFLEQKSKATFKVFFTLIIKGLVHF